MRKYIVEFVATYFLVLTVILSVSMITTRFMIPVVIFAVLTVMIYSGRYISGAHYNPAVTLAVLIRGKIEFLPAIWYVASQLLSAVLAVISCYVLIDGQMTQIDMNLVTAFSFKKGFIAEFLGTFALVWVILHTATARVLDGNLFYGFCISLTVLVGIFLFGGISGGVFNPAVALGLWMAEMIQTSAIFSLIIGQICGGIAAAFLFKYVNKD